VFLVGASGGPDLGGAVEGISLIRHDLAVNLVPAERRIVVEDVISFPAETPKAESIEFFLNAGLEVESGDPAYTVERLSEPGPVSRAATHEIDREREAVGLHRYRLQPTEGTWPLEPKPRVRFAGDIQHGLVEEGDYARSFARTAGTISVDGVALSGSSHWVPRFGSELVSFGLTVAAPEDWDVVSQGKRTLHELAGDKRRVRWECPDPMEEVHLVAGRFTEYSRAEGRITAYAFLRTPDAALAEKYLEVTFEYIEMYSRLIGDYPFEKFALVENFWETGYGMSSFTLLGPTVIRLPSGGATRYSSITKEETGAKG
jgi:hypothetical protein